jgi:predicted lysophospholipase L1 biosynthesis ABC-type transport system permease subunit
VARGSGKDVNWCTIVGVVGNVKTEGLDVPDHPQIYLPAYQESGLGLAIFLRTKGGEGSLIQAVRREIHAADPDLPIYNVFTMDDIVMRSLSQRRFIAGVIGAFAGVSLFLAGLGSYGVIALTVSQRIREFGVRIALGASRRQITTLVLQRGLIVAAVGVTAGGFGGIMASLAMRGMLFQITPMDPLIWISIASLILAVSVFSCWLPARRAANVDPNIALKCD